MIGAIAFFFRAPETIDEHDDDCLDKRNEHDKKNI